MAMLDATNLQPTVAALQRELDQRTAERDEALAQQAATSEILRDLALADRHPAGVRRHRQERSQNLRGGVQCGGPADEGLLHLVALHSMSPEESAAF
jgi:hypothetical protein